jgi:homoserine kinase
MPPTTVTVRVPATSANLGPGFDALGIALDLAGEVTLTWSDRPARFPDNRGEQLALGAAQAVYVHAGRPRPPGLQIAIKSEIPIGRGLGASAVLRAGAVLGANVLLGSPFSEDEVLGITAELEGHADNAAPAILGGFQVVVREEGRVTHVRVPLPAELRAVLFVPELEMPTGESRKLLPRSLERRDAVHNIGRAALLVAALATGRLDALDLATQDVLHQPARSKLFPAMFAIFAAAREAGAHCAYLSGGGSSIMALATTNEAAIGAAMAARAAAAGVRGRVLQTRPASPAPKSCARAETTAARCRGRGWTDGDHRAEVRRLLAGDGRADQCRRPAGAPRP